MKKKLLLVILILLIVLLGIVLALISFISKTNKDVGLSETQLADIEMGLSNTNFLNCIYSSPDNIDVYYILLACKDEATRTKEDDVEYIYLSSLDSENYSLEALYPEIMNSRNLTAAQKKTRIIQEITRQVEEEGITSNSSTNASDDIPALSYKKIMYDTASNLILKNTNLSNEKVEELLNNLKNSYNVLFSDDYNCFYIGTASRNSNISDYSLKCISGVNNNNVYTVQYTLELPDGIEERTQFETSFYIENDEYKFISNRCVTADKMKKKAEEFEKSINNVMTVTDENGSVYGYINSTSAEGIQYYIEGGTNTAYYKLCYVKTKNNNYFFTKDLYFYLDVSENNNNFLTCYPRQVMNYDYSWLNENFERIIKKTGI